MTIQLERIQDLSIFYDLRNLLPTFITIVDGFPGSETSVDPKLVLPTVSIDSLDLSPVPFELGSLDKTKRFWAIDVFAKNKSQRDDFTYTIFNHLKDSVIPVYNYDLGFPPIIVPQIGYLISENINAKPIYVFKDLVQDLYWRSRITFFTKYTEV